MKKRRRQYRPVPWKRNIRRLPRHIERKLRGLEGEVVAAAVRRIPVSDIASGHYAHVGLRVENDSVVADEYVLPQPNQGRCSRRNRHGWVEVFVNRPKVVKTYDFEVPNWGDWSKGSHTIYVDRDVYQRQHRSPKLLQLRVEIIGQDGTSVPMVVVRFTVCHTLDTAAATFDEDLFFDLNLLQENVGHCDVYARGASDEAYLVCVDWEILPPGTREVHLEKIIGRSQVTDIERREIEERYDYLMDFEPARVVVGTSGFVRYFGAVFAEDLVVFENVHYGNALYVMFEDWEVLSQRSRTELLNAPDTKFIRIAHRAGWKRKLASVLWEIRNAA